MVWTFWTFSLFMLKIDILRVGKISVFFIIDTMNDTKRFSLFMLKIFTFYVKSWVLSCQDFMLLLEIVIIIDNNIFSLFMLKVEIFVQ